MAMPVEERKKLVKAKLEEAAAKKKAAKMPAVVKRPYDPENMYLSKKEFLEKNRKMQEDEVAAKEFIANRNNRKGDTGEDVEPVEEQVVKNGRPKKVE